MVCDKEAIVRSDGVAEFSANLPELKLGVGSLKGFWPVEYQPRSVERLLDEAR
jgi:hypothetical protein